MVTNSSSPAARWLLTRAGLRSFHTVSAPSSTCARSNVIASPIRPPSRARTAARVITDSAVPNTSRLASSASVRCDHSIKT